MATEYCAWPDGCTGFFNYPDGDQAARLTKADELEWSLYHNAPPGFADRLICDRHTKMRIERIWKETGAQGGKPAR